MNFSGTWGLDMGNHATTNEQHALPADFSGAPNNRWSVDAVESLFATPFNDLIFRAQEVHRETCVLVEAVRHARDLGQVVRMAITPHHQAARQLGSALAPVRRGQQLRVRAMDGLILDTDPDPGNGG